MRGFFRGVKNIAKSVARTLRKGMDVGEKIVNTVDKHTGGMLKKTASTLTGGLSDRALDLYNANKKHIKSGLDVIAGDKSVKKALEGTKYEKNYNNVMRNVGHVSNAVDKVSKIDNPLIDKARSSEIGKNVLRANERIKPFIR